MHSATWCPSLSLQRNLIWLFSAGFFPHLSKSVVKVIHLFLLSPLLICKAYNQAKVAHPDSAKSSSEGDRQKSQGFTLDAHPDRHTTQTAGRVYCIRKKSKKSSKRLRTKHSYECDFKGKKKSQRYKLYSGRGAGLIPPPAVPLHQPTAMELSTVQHNHTHGSLVTLVTCARPCGASWAQWTRS